MDWVAPIVLIFIGVLVWYPVYKGVREAKGKKKVIWIIVDDILLSVSVWAGFLSINFGGLSLVNVIKHLH
jgi:hypothetical protein